MTLQDLGALGELIAAIAVFITQMNDPSITHAVVKEGPLSEEEQARLQLPARDKNLGRVA